MGYSCKILLDSISETNKRLTTFEITFPRIVLAEFNTHRAFSRNSASSRDIPFEKQVDRLYDDPFIPEQFPLNCAGMQPQEYITKDSPDYKFASQEWILARNVALTQARQLRAMNIHKQIVNRLLEPFQWHTVLITATEFDNFFKLRTHSDAQYEIKRIADLMYEAYHYYVETDSKGLKERNYLKPQKLKIGEWHCPLVSEEDKILVNEFMFLQKERNIFSQQELLKRISVARSARISYLTRDGKRDIEKDLELFERLRTSGHWSPMEHVATPYYENVIALPAKRDLWSANFLGWKQYRKWFQDENCTNFRKEN